jgi:tetratricopeptide (TPR) repeat protein
MPRKLTFRQLVVKILALWRDLNDKIIGVRSGLAQKRVSQLLCGEELSDAQYEKLLAGVEATQAEVAILIYCLEALENLEKDDGLTRAKREVIVQQALVAARRFHDALTEAALRSQETPGEGYPKPEELAPARRRAEELWARLKGLDARERPFKVILDSEYHSWALCERACEASVREASRNLERAAEWARLAQEIAALVSGSMAWRNSIRGYAGGHAANVLKVAGELKPARAAMEQAKLLCHEGSDPAGVLDPGRMLDLEASLCIAERRFDRVLPLLDEAAAVGHHPERSLMLKGIRLEKMGEYEGAVETYLRAVPGVDRQTDPRQWSILHFNLSVCYSHLGLYHEAGELVEAVQPLAAEMGDEIALVRCTWLRGRILAGLGRTVEALSLLEHARRGFERWKMWYDVAQCLLEEAALLLDEGKSAEVKALSRELTSVFASKGVHREALAALRLFSEAVEQETATAKLARRVLDYLFRARADEGLRFTGS